MTRAYPKEFRDDIVAVARKGQVPSSLIAKDFGVPEGSLSNWLKRANVQDGHRVGLAKVEWVELRETKKRIRLLEQEN